MVLEQLRELISEGSLPAIVIPFTDLSSIAPRLGESSPSHLQYPQALRVNGPVTGTTSVFTTSQVDNAFLQESISSSSGIQNRLPSNDPPIRSTSSSSTILSPTAMDYNDRHSLQGGSDSNFDQRYPSLDGSVPSWGYHNTVAGQWNQATNGAGNSGTSGLTADALNVARFLMDTDPYAHAANVASRRQQDNSFNWSERNSAIENTGDNSGMENHLVSKFHFGYISYRSLKRHGSYGRDLKALLGLCRA